MVITEKPSLMRHTWSASLPHKYKLLKEIVLETMNGGWPSVQKSPKKWSFKVGTHQDTC